MVDQKRLVDNFFEIVSIDSLSFKEKKLVDYLARKLKGLGFSIKVDGAGAIIGGNTGNLIAHLPGNSDKPPIYFNCHLDTVEPGIGVEPVLEDGIIRAAGETVLGADDKAGIAAILEMAYIAVEGEETHGPIDLVFTVAEETGLLGAKNLDWSLVTGEYGFVLDAAGLVGEIYTVAPWQNTISAVFRGRAAHAGVNPELGVSAVQAAARAIETMPLGRRDSETTANIGEIKGGRAPNIVPELAEIKGEARSLKLNKLDRQTDRMVQAINHGAKAFGAEVDVDVAREYDGYNLSSKKKVVVWASEAIKHIGLEPIYASTGGGSDTNVFNSRGAPTVNLGVGYIDPHTTNESISQDQLRLAAELAVAIALR